ncbi:MAG: rRNA pseudouridine synthase [Hyphomonas sp.]|uniref:pseudouridine synthase n=1 Tax=Hyphomonas sp. TaxID=87 RepID=UPI0017FB283B|nr:pseudouridine synthase [Hyphomonas sp.]MBA3067745.1 rRNA pseudouridine synthase [Hyphomonas sp.]MBU3919964.1 rRNA pseudouridine synthase [Alphaproteobacteria bacterium]MBU4062167.1 rRNA pseudouridine synthase [Alphaproteobacteria bacterium]MBU4165602.1 rRNA pseudouridine synthase [Alphaproteobacteria bacterium]
MSDVRKLAKQLAALGYGSRKEMAIAIRDGRVTGDGDALRIDGEPLDPPAGMILMLNKPAGFTCSHSDQGRLVYDLMPARFQKRDPKVSSVGRLDADTTGLLLFTDDGALLHRLISPKSSIEKTYDAHLARPLEGHEAALFASGTLVLRGEDKPCLPAQLDVTGERTARLTLNEGRYHQVRRMFAAAGNHVETLHRSRFGPLTLGDLPDGAWRLLEPAEVAALRA